MGTRHNHLGYVERLSIGEGLRIGLSVRAIARRLGRAPSTVSREIRRMGPPHWQHYIPAQALHLARRRRSESNGLKSRHIQRTVSIYEQDRTKVPVL